MLKLNFTLLRLCLPVNVVIGWRWRGGIPPKLDIGFESDVDNAAINGIEIIPAP